MKFNSFLAFLLTLVALIMLIGLLVWWVIQVMPDIRPRPPEYCNNFSATIIPESYSAKLEVGKGKLIKVNMTNHGFEDEFKISLEGPEWTATRPFKLRLTQGQSDDIFVYMSPTLGVEGNYTVTVFAKSYCGTEMAEIKVVV